MSRQRKAIELAVQIVGASGRPSNRKLTGTAGQAIKAILEAGGIEVKGKKLAVNGEPARQTDTVKDGDKITVTEKPEGS